MNALASVLLILGSVWFRVEYEISAVQGVLLGAAGAVGFFNLITSIANTIVITVARRKS